MANKNGVSFVMITLIALVMLAVTFLVFFNLQRGAFFQESALFQQASKATEAIPCIKAPVLQIRPVTYINPTVEDVKKMQAYVPAQFNASISSACGENVTVVWQFGDDSQPVTTECAFTPQGYAQYDAVNRKWTNENCTTINHTYSLTLDDIWSSIPVRISVFGLSSGYSTEASTVGFVTDPNFNLIIEQSDIKEFPCTKMKYTLTSSKVIDWSALPVELKISDNKRIRGAQYLSKPVEVGSNFPHVYTGNLSYFSFLNSDNSAQHDIVVSTTIGYQTNLSTVKFAAAATNLAEEIFILGKDKLEIYDKNLELVLPNIYPEGQLAAWVESDFDIGDLNGDGLPEIIFIYDGKNKDLGELLITSSNEWDFRQFSKASKNNTLKFWPWRYGLENIGRARVSVAKAVNFAGQTILDAILVLSESPPKLNLYKYHSLGVEEVNVGELADEKWKDLDVADVNGDHEDEVILLGEKLAVIKYGKEGALDLSAVEAPTLDLSWSGWDKRAVTTGRFSTTANMQIATLLIASDGNTNILIYGLFGGKLNLLARLDFSELAGFENRAYNDITSADIDNDDYDELIIVDDSGTSMCRIDIDGKTGTLKLQPYCIGIDVGNRPQIIAGDYLCKP